MAGLSGPFCPRKAIAYSTLWKAALSIFLAQPSRMTWRAVFGLLQRKIVIGKMLVGSESVWRELQPSPRGILGFRVLPQLCIHHAQRVQRSRVVGIGGYDSLVGLDCLVEIAGGRQILICVECELIALAGVCTVGRQLYAAVM